MGKCLRPGKAGIGMVRLPVWGRIPLVGACLAPCSPPHSGLELPSIKQRTNGPLHRVEGRPVDTGPARTWPSSQKPGRRSSKKPAATRRTRARPEVQISMLTARIREISEHCKLHDHDFHSRRDLVMLVGKAQPPARPTWPRPTRPTIRRPSLDSACVSKPMRPAPLGRAVVFMSLRCWPSGPATNVHREPSEGCCGAAVGASGLGHAAIRIGAFSLLSRPVSSLKPYAFCLSFRGTFARKSRHTWGLCSFSSRSVASTVCRVRGLWVIDREDQHVRYPVYHDHAHSGHDQRFARSGSSALTIETGVVGKLANATVLVTFGGTTVLASVVPRNRAKASTSSPSRWITARTATAGKFRAALRSAKAHQAKRNS